MAENANLFHVDDKDFEAKVLNSETPVIVDFWAAWCGPCRAIAPVFEKLSTEYEGRLGFAKMDIDENNQTAMALQIQAIPTLMMFKSGKLIGRFVGPHPSTLKREIDRVLAQQGTAAK
ncbi:MAG TPA: thioredoxin [Ktedonobacter sp.]|nr:thioredoxin [Ktedonobacter sp.]